MNEGLIEDYYILNFICLKNHEQQIALIIVKFTLARSDFGLNTEH